MAGEAVSKRFRSKWKHWPAAKVWPSRWVARKTKGRGQSASPLGPGVTAAGSNIRAYGQVVRHSHVLADWHCGTQAIRRKMVPNAPRRILDDLPSGKWIDSFATKVKRRDSSWKSKQLF